MKEQGFVNACELKIGDELLDAEQNVLMVEDTYYEVCDEAVIVYNFEVEDFHTYHVGNVFVLVHNDCDVIISRSRYPESAKHIEDAINNGHPKTLTIDRTGAKARRKQSLAGKPKVTGKDLDEFPPAMFKEGGLREDGKLASVRAILSSDNRGAGSSFGHQLRGQPDGTKVTFIIVD